MNRTNSKTGSRAPGADIPIDFRRLYHELRERAWLIALCTIGVVLLAGAYLVRTPKTFASRSTIMVEQQESKVVNIQDVTQDDLKALEVMKTVEQSLTTDALMLRVVKANNLASNPAFLPQQDGQHYTEDELIRALSERITVRLRRGTRLIDITAESRDPGLAKQLAQSVVDEFVRQGFDQRIGVSQEANQFLVQEAQRLRAKLEKSERDLQDYREKNHAVSLEDKQNIVVETLKDLNAKLNDARSSRMKLESDFAQAKELAGRDPSGLLVLASVSDSPSVLEAKKRVADEEAQIASLSRRYRAEHPKFIQAQSELAQTKAELNKTILKAGESIAAAYETARVNEQKLEESLRSQEKLSFELNKIAIPYSGLAREVESDRALYESIVTRLKETDVTKTLDKSPIRIVEPARIPVKPVRPRKLLILAGSLAAGFGFGVSLALLLQALDGSLKTVDETERALNLHVIAAIPRLASAKSGEVNWALPTVGDPYSPAAEAFRSLRTVLSLKEPTGRQVLLFTSAAPGEGKTFSSVNCAVALAQQGHRTLLIDADLRRPSIAKVLRLNPDHPGLAEHLAGTGTLSAVVQESGIEHLSVLAAGSTVRNPGELLSAANLERLWQEPLFASFERIIFDTAPVAAVSDALTLVRHATAVCLVVRAAVTPAKIVQRAAAALTSAGAHEMTVVLNALPADSRSAYYYYTAAYERPTAESATPLVRQPPLLQPKASSAAV